MKTDLAGLAVVFVLAAACAEGSDGGTGSIPQPTTVNITSGPTGAVSDSDPGDSDGSATTELPTTGAPPVTTEPPGTSGPVTTGAMTGVCGDDNVDPGEECDGASLVGSTCMTEGFQSGTLVCSPDCKLFTAGCYNCGDGIVAEAEACDGANFKDKSCQSLGYGGGSLQCAPDCKSIDTGGCTPLASCGNGTKEGSEQCDGGQLGGQTCVGLGYDEGALTCSGSCTFNTAGCVTLDCAGQGEICLFDENNLQSNCCPPGVKGNVLGICDIIICF